LCASSENIKRFGPTIARIAGTVSSSGFALGEDSPEKVGVTVIGKHDVLGRLEPNENVP
jgi:hypothetical protein